MQRNITSERSRRRGAVAVMVMVILMGLLGFAALTVDVGAMYNVRADLQRTADAAALAGASAFVTDDMMRVRMGTGGSDVLAAVTSLAAHRTQRYAGMNYSLGTSSSNILSEDLVIGWLNLNNDTSEMIHTNPQPKDFNAVGVTTRRSQAANGAHTLTFASLLGFSSTELGAWAVAVFDDRVSGLTVTDGATDIMPLSMSRAAFDQDLGGGGDQYSYDDATSSVSSTSDGIREIRIYPYPLSGSGYSEGDGNFGMLNIGTGNQGVEAERDQIEYGAPASDFELEIGTSQMDFSVGGSANSYDITGSPGLEATLQSTLGTRVGDVVGIFLHDGVTLSGSNATYTISGIRYVRIMAVRLTGQPELRGVFVQPVSFVGSEVQINPEAPSSGGLVGRLTLAR